MRNNNFQTYLLLILTALLSSPAFAGDAFNLPLTMERAMRNPGSAKTLSFSMDIKYTAESLKAVRETRDLYKNSITDLETDHGAYYYGIGEKLLSLGLNLRKQGEYQEAIDAFGRALYLNRVNQGLHNLNQLPIVELLIETNTAISDWNALDENYNYLYWVYLRNYGNDKLELLPIIDRLARWNLNAYKFVPASELPYYYLLNALKFYKGAIEIIEQQNGDMSPLLINPLYGITLTSYEMTAHVVNAKNADEIFNSIRRYEIREQAAMRMERSRGEMAYNSYKRGKKAMQRVVDVYRNSSILPVESHALALTHLADWLFIFNRKQSAMKTYKKAYQLMSESNSEQISLEEIFGKPKSLPVIRIPLEYKQINRDRFVLAKFDVSKSGRAKEITILESQPSDSKTFLRHARKTIKATQFRPRMLDGQAVATQNVNVRYIFE